MEWKKSLPMLLGALIIATGLCIAANTLANRPMQGSLSGSLVATSGGRYEHPDVMDTRSLLDYLMIYPDIKYDVEYSSGDSSGQPAEMPTEYVDPYDEAMQNLITAFEADVLSSKLPGFPFVQIDNRMYYSKAAVDQWFADMGTQQLVVG